MIQKSLQLLLVATFALVLVVGCAPARFENEYVPAAIADQSAASIPSGMRRTKYGWEDASLWYLPAGQGTRSLQSWIDQQHSLEPAWIRRLFETIRSTPPLMIAVIQIIAIAVIFRISRYQNAL